MSDSREKIKIKSLFSNWKVVTKKQAKTYVKFLLDNITTMSYEEKIDYINSKKLQGITVQELFKNGAD